MKTLWINKSALGAALILAAASGAILGAPVQAYAAAAQSKQGVKLTSSALIERTEKDASGAEIKVMKTPAQVSIVPGDRVVFVLDYTNEGSEAASGFRATNPMPAPIQFTGVREDWAEVSVDGGKAWGKLSALTISSGEPAAVRAATEADVTDVRWVFPADIAPGKSGSLSYSGIVK